jgi:hypothetical protein
MCDRYIAEWKKSRAYGMQGFSDFRPANVPFINGPFAKFPGMTYFRTILVLK